MLIRLLEVQHLQRRCPGRRSSSLYNKKKHAQCQKMEKHVPACSHHCVMPVLVSQDKCPRTTLSSLLQPIRDGATRNAATKNTAHCQNIFKILVRRARTSCTPPYLKQILCVHCIKKKRSKCCNATSTKAWFLQIMEIQRPPEVASKTQSPVRKEARWTISPEHIDCQLQF